MVLLSRRVKIALALVTVAVLFAVFLLPGFAEGESGFSTSVFVGTPDGEEVVYDEDGGLFGATIAQVSGTTITYIRWETEYQAVSDDYTSYTIPSGTLVVEALKPTGGVCGPALKDLTFSIGAERDVEVWYPLTSYNLTAEALVNHIDTHGCPLEGDYTLRYRVSLTVQAVGVGELPTDTDSGTYLTTVSLTAGSIEAIESTTSTSG